MSNVPPPLSRPRARPTHRDRWTPLLSRRLDGALRSCLPCGLRIRSPALQRLPNGYEAVAGGGRHAAGVRTGFAIVKSGLTVHVGEVVPAEPLSVVSVPIDRISIDYDRVHCIDVGLVAEGCFDDSVLDRYPVRVTVSPPATISIYPPGHRRRPRLPSEIALSIPPPLLTAETDLCIICIDSIQV